MSVPVPAPIIPLQIDLNPFLRNPGEIESMKERTIIDDILLPINDPEENNKPFNIFYYYHVFSRLGLDHTVMNSVQSTQGGNNVVYFSSNSPYLLRISRKNDKTLYQFTGTIRNVPDLGKLFVGFTLPKNYRGRSQQSHTTILNTITNDEQNTLDASNNYLSPKLFYMGNMLLADGKIYRFMIMEKYDATLTDLLIITSNLPDTPPLKDDDTYDESIPNRNNIFYHPQYGLATQLTRLLDEVIDKLGIICYDIKPANCVVKNIKDDEGNFSHYMLRLIDWDSDFCKKEQFSVDKVIEIGNCIKFFNLLILANFLYLRHNQNFLFNIVRDRYDPTLWNSWMEIFTDFDKQYSKHMIHYFYRDFMIDSPEAQQIRQSIENETITPDEKESIKKTCEEHALIMLQNAYKFDSTPPVTEQAARSGTPVIYSNTRLRTRTQSEQDLHRLISASVDYYPDPMMPSIPELNLPSNIQKKGGKSRKKRSRKRR